jgi:ubiquinone/menaquinone biosynthesis C-methylase UbiE
MNLPNWLLDSLRDPQTLEPLVFTSPDLLASANQQYRTVNGIPSLVYPPTLEGMDSRMNRVYRWLAPIYDQSERVLGRILTGEDILEGRANIVRLLALRPGVRLLEVSPGPGVFQHLLRSAIGEDGELVSVDLSLPMLRQCQSIQSKTRAHLIHANGAHLPFADFTFDAVFHFGGVNLFSEPQQAVAEFVRVIKPNGIVAYGDEGFAREFPDGWRKKILVKMNPGYLASRPSLPAGIRDITEHVVYGGLGYLVVAKRL